MSLSVTGAAVAIGDRTDVGYTFPTVAAGDIAVAIAFIPGTAGGDGWNDGATPKGAVYWPDGNPAKASDSTALDLYLRICDGSESAATYSYKSTNGAIAIGVAGFIVQGASGIASVGHQDGPTYSSPPWVSSKNIIVPGDPTGTNIIDFWAAAGDIQNNTLGSINTITSDDSFLTLIQADDFRDNGGGGFTPKSASSLAVGYSLGGYNTNNTFSFGTTATHDGFSTQSFFAVRFRLVFEAASSAGSDAWGWFGD